MRGIFITQRKNRERSRPFLTFLVSLLTFSLVFSPVAGYAQTVNILNLPLPGSMVQPSPAFAPVLLKGITIHADDPLKFDFIIDSGDTGFVPEQIKQESEKLVKYFLAAMTVPKDDLWVNLSPYEADRIIPDELGKTELGRDMLAQDYILKQLTASLMYPEKDLGKEFWDKVYQEAKEKYGTTEIPVNTFNKVWILPETATVYEHGTTVYIVEAKLKVMLDSDYMAQSHQVTTSQGHQKAVMGDVVTGDPVTTQIVREVILPAIEKEVNEGQNFAPLRQIYHSLILAKWYKETIKNSLLSKVYIDQNKTAGIESDDTTVKDQIYAQYMEAYTKGVFNYIKEDYDRLSREVIPRKYFSGGIDRLTNITLKHTSSPVEDSKTPKYRIEVGVSPQGNKNGVLRKLADISKTATTLTLIAGLTCIGSGCTSTYALKDIYKDNYLQLTSDHLLLKEINQHSITANKNKSTFAILLKNADLKEIEELLFQSKQPDFTLDEVMAKELLLLYPESNYWRYSFPVVNFAEDWRYNFAIARMRLTGKIDGDLVLKVPNNDKIKELIEKLELFRKEIDSEEGSEREQKLLLAARMIHELGYYGNDASEGLPTLIRYLDYAVEFSSSKLTHETERLAHSLGNYFTDFHHRTREKGMPAPFGVFGDISQYPSIKIHPIFNIIKRNMDKIVPPKNETEMVALYDFIDSKPIFSYDFFKANIAQSLLWTMDEIYLKEIVKNSSINSESQKIAQKITNRGGGRYYSGLFKNAELYDPIRSVVEIEKLVDQSMLPGIERRIVRRLYSPDKLIQMAAMKEIVSNLPEHLRDSAKKVLFESLPSAMPDSQVPRVLSEVNKLLKERNYQVYPDASIRSSIQNVNERVRFYLKYLSYEKGFLKKEVLRALLEDASKISDENVINDLLETLRDYFRGQESLEGQFLTAKLLEKLGVGLEILNAPIHDLLSKELKVLNEKENPEDISRTMFDSILYFSDFSENAVQVLRRIVYGEIKVNDIGITNAKFMSVDKLKSLNIYSDKLVLEGYLRSLQYNHPRWPQIPTFKELANSWNQINDSGKQRVIEYLTESLSPDSSNDQIEIFLILKKIGANDIVEKRKQLEIHVREIIFKKFLKYIKDAHEKGIILRKYSEYIEETGVKYFDPIITYENIREAIKLLEKDGDFKVEVFRGGIITVKSSSSPIILDNSNNINEAMNNLIVLTESNENLGGIDMNDIDVDRQGAGVDIRFDPVELREIIESGIDGFTPVIINIVPLPSVLPLLGLEPRKEEEREELSKVH